VTYRRTSLFSIRVLFFITSVLIISSIKVMLSWEGRRVSLSSSEREGEAARAGEDAEEEEEGEEGETKKTKER